MVAAHELALVDQPSTAEPTIILMAMPVGAWRTISDLARQPRHDENQRHLRRAIESTVQMDSVLHVCLRADGDTVDISLHTHASAAETALAEWLRLQPELWPGITTDDWHHLRESGLAPEGLAASSIVMLPVDTSRVRTGGRHR